MNHMLYTNYNYDALVDYEVQVNGDQLVGYTLHDLREYEGRNFKYPFFRVVTLGP
jgi:hypothetical protein